MGKMKKNSENGNGRLFTKASSQTAEIKEDRDESLKKVLQRAVNREDAPENLLRMIKQKIRQ